MDQKQMSAFFMFIGGLLLIVGAATTWFSGLGLEVTGIDEGDGTLTFIAGTVLGLIGAQVWVQGVRFKWVAWVAWAAWAIAAFVGLYNFFDILGKDRISLGIGMWITVLGLIGVLIGILRLPKMEQVPAPEVHATEEVG